MNQASLGLTVGVGIRPHIPNPCCQCTSPSMTACTPHYDAPSSESVTLSSISWILLEDGPGHQTHLVQNLSKIERVAAREMGYVCVRMQVAVYVSASS